MGISDFLSSYKGKRITGTAYGLGASVVIIGALFKIMHWPAAGLVLGTGMFVEAFLFALSALEKPHKTWEWSLVYPELEGEEEKGGKKKEAKVPQVDVAALVEGEMKKLSDGVRRLGETAGQLGSLTTAAAVSDAYVNNLSKASEAANAFATSQKSLKDSSDSLVASYQDIATSIGSASKGSKDFASQIDGISKNASAINSIFELQAKSSAEQNEAMKKLAATVAKMEAAMISSAKEAEDYKQQVATLAQQMKSLNSVYGNMLNAMTIRG